MPLLGVSTGVSTLLYGLSVAGGPDMLLIGAAPLLGKDNLTYLFSKLGGWLKNFVRWDQVTPKRYRVGIWLLIISVLTSLVRFYIFPESLRIGNYIFDNQRSRKMPAEAYQPCWKSTNPVIIGLSTQLEVKTGSKIDLIQEAV